MYRQIGGRWVRQFLFSVPNTGSFQCIRLMFTFTRLSGSGDNIKTPSGSSSVASYFPFVKLGSQINSPRGKRSILEQDKYRIYPWSQNSLRYPCWKERKHRYIDTQSHFLALCKLVSESKPYCEFPNSGEGSKSWSILPISSSASQHPTVCDSASLPVALSCIGSCTYSSIHSAIRLNGLLPA